MKRLLIAVATVAYLAFLGLVVGAILASNAHTADKFVMGAFWFALFVLVPLGALVAVFIEKGGSGG